MSAARQEEEETMKSCEYCVNRATCTRDTGVIYSGCNVEFEPDEEVIYQRLDNLEGCEDNSVYASEIKQLRAML